MRRYNDRARNTTPQSTSSWHSCIEERREENQENISPNRRVRRKNCYLPPLPPTSTTRTLPLPLLPVPTIHQPQSLLQHTKIPLHHLRPILQISKPIKPLIRLLRLLRPLLPLLLQFRCRFHERGFLDGDGLAVRVQVLGFLLAEGGVVGAG